MIRSVLLLFTVSALAWAAKETYEYDAAGRLTSVAYGDGTKIVYAYDAAGNLRSTKVQRPAAAAPTAKPKASSTRADSAKPPTPTRP